MRFAPALRLITEFALAVGVGFRRTGPLRRLQFVDQARSLACRDDEPGACFLIRLHRFGAVEPRIGARIDRLRTLRHGRQDLFQMTRDLFAGGPVAIAQLARYVFPRLRQKRQNRLVALLAPVFRVVAPARAHLMTEQRVHRGVGVQRDRLQIHMRRFPYAPP